MKCCICEGQIFPEGPNGTWTQGHNAEPVKSGRCCAACNSNVVVPVRLMRAMNASQEETAGNG